MHLRTVIATLIAPALVALAQASPAWAQADAQQLFADAQQRFDQRDYGGALPLFQQALEVSKSPNARLYVGRCLRALGRVVEAYDAMYATTREATKRAEADPKYGPTRDAAASELALLEPLVGKVVIAWSGAKSAAITLDGKAVAAEKVGEPVTVMPGEHVVVVTPPGGKAIEQKILVEGGQSRMVTIGPEGGTGPGKPGEGEPSPEPAAESSGGVVRMAGYGVTALGVAGMVLFGVGASQAQGKWGQLEDECGAVRCADPAYADTIDSGKTWQTVANVSLGVGIAALAGGIAMIIFGGPSEPETPAAEPGATAARARQPRWAVDLGSVPGLGGTLGARASF
jgi:hypothetical protein